MATAHNIPTIENMNSLLSMLQAKCCTVVYLWVLHSVCITVYLWH